MPLRPPGTPDVDLTIASSFGVVDDAVFQTGQLQSAGTGVFNTFVQIQHNGTEQGYNTSGPAQFDEKNSAQFNHALLLANVPIVIGDGTNGTVEGVAYRQFLLDINDANGAKQFLSLDKLQIWQEESGSLGNFTSGSGFAGAHTNDLAYNLDAGADRWIALNDGLSHGSGQSDVVVLIPDSFFINDTEHRYVYLYSAFGYQSGWAADGGFEEWGVSTPGGAPGTTAALAMDKDASVPGGTADHAGEVITYSFKLFNVGDKALTGITLTDGSVSDLTRGADIFGNNDNILDVGETWSFTAHHTVTQAEIDSNGGGSGTIANTATADSNETGPVTKSASVDIEQGLHATLVKTASVLGGTADAAGELISYTISLTNDGLTTLTNPVVTDSMVTSQTPILDPAAPIHTNAQFFVPVLDGDFNLGDTNQNGVWDAGETFQFVYPGDISNDGIHDPGETWSAINLGDTNNDGIHQVGEVWVGDTNQNGVEDTGERWQFKNLGDTNHNNLQDPGETWQYLNVGDTNQNGAQDPGETFQFINVGDTNRNGIQDAGETFQFYNAGDTNHNGIEDPGETFQFNVSHDVPGVDVDHDGFNDGDTNHDGELNVGETWQFAFTHAVTQAEIDNGGIVDPDLTIDNTATASTGQVVSIATGSASVPVEQRPELQIMKTADVDSVDADGDVINYSITVHNTGNMSLTDLVVSDPFVSNLAGVDADHDTFNDGDTNHDGKLSVDETWQYTASHTVTQAEIDNNGVVNPALKITNTASADTAQTDPQSASASVSVLQNPDLEIHKLVSSITSTDQAVGTTTVGAAGDVINYTIAVHNTGNMTLTNLGVTDPFVSDLAAVDDNHDGFNDGDANHDGKLDLDETWQYTASHTVTQPEMDAGGSIDNTASASTHQGASGSDSVSVTVEQNAHLAFDKTGAWADGDSDGLADPGELVHYTFSVTNDGNVSLHGAEVSDTVLGGPLTGPDSGDTLNPGVLDVGETWVYHADYAITQTDIDTGNVHNTATATATGPQNQPASGSDSSDVSLPHLALDISDLAGTIFVDHDEDGVDADGDLIEFAITLKNLSGGTLTNITVSDLLGDVGATSPAVPASLAPGAEWHSAYNHFLTAADLAAGHVFDKLTVTATDSQNHAHTIMAEWNQVL